MQEGMGPTSVTNLTVCRNSHGVRPLGVQRHSSQVRPTLSTAFSFERGAGHGRKPRLPFASNRIMCQRGDHDQIKN